MIANKQNMQNQKGFAPIQIILSILAGTIILGGIVGGVLYFSKTKLPAGQQNQAQDKGYCGDGICQDIEKERGVCGDCKDSQPATTTPTTPQPTTPQPTTPQPTQPTPTTTQEPEQTTGNNSLDADGFLWGTEVWLDSDKIDASYKSAINDNLKTKNVRIRLGIANVSSDNNTFSTTACFPSFKDCSRKRIDLDDIVKKFKSNGWSMIPMLSYGYHGTTESFSSSDIEKYVNFVDWFVSRYKNDANIKYVELENCPNCNLSLTVSKELLLEATNKIYDTVKGKYPDIMMGTPGFEYWIDEQNAKMVTMIEHFLDKNNGAKFDYWAFHGYQLSMKGNNLITTLPPTKSPSYNKYAGAKGILEIRKKLDSNGWQNRMMIDTENGTVFPGIPYTTDEEKTDAAYYVQSDLIRRTQRLNDKFVLAGKITLKTRTRENLSGVAGDATAGDLNSSGSPYKSYKAISFLLSKLNEYNYSSHISGEWDAENTPWIEKFTSGSNKELYIFFKPFKYQSGKELSLDNETVNYTLNLAKTPKSITLTDIEGNVSNVTASKTVTLQAVNSPKYLEINY